jgi:hypothetical protein
VAGSAGIATFVLPSAAVASSGGGTPSSAVTYLSNAGQTRSGTQRHNGTLRLQQRCIAGSTGYVNYGTLAYDIGQAATPTSLEIRLYADSSGSVGSQLGILDYASHSGGQVVCTSVTPIVVAAGSFWVEARSSGNTYLYLIGSLASTGQSGWSITSDADGPIVDGTIGTVSTAIEFSLRYEP